MWDSLQNILPKVAGKYHFKKTLDALEICHEYRRLAPTILRGESLKNTFPKSYENRTLTVAALNSAWAQQLHMHKHRIQQAINQKYGENTVQKINIQITERMPQESFLDNKN